MSDDITKNFSDDPEIMEKLWNDNLFRMSVEKGMNLGMSKIQIYEKTILFLLNLNDEVFQEKLNAIMNSEHPDLSFLDNE